MSVFNKVDVPEGQSGEWKVSRFKPEGLFAEMHNIKYPRRQLTIGDTYTKLTHHGDVVMSDTPAELRDLRQLGQNLRGRILINGLGLGVALQGALDEKEVYHVTVIELSRDVISLVGQHYMARYGNKLLTIIHADAMDWIPPKGLRYNTVWHDIWPTICGDNYESMKKLHRKYGKRCNWQGSWCKKEVKNAQ